MFLHEVLEIFAVFPPDASQIVDDGYGVTMAIVVASEIDGAAVEIKADRLRASVVRLEHFLDEVTFLDLECAGEAGRGAKGFRVFPREGDTADAAHRRAEHGGVARGFLRAIFLIDQRLEFLEQEGGVVGVAGLRRRPRWARDIPGNESGSCRWRR